MKKVIQQTIFSEQFDTYDYEVRFSDLPADLKPDDIIVIIREDWEPDGGGSFTYLEVIRERLETDEEYEERVESNRVWEEQQKEKRYSYYLKLKEEFEPTP